jgi:hypothetical protein
MIHIHPKIVVYVSFYDTYKGVSNKPKKMLRCLVLVDLKRIKRKTAP